MAEKYKNYKRKHALSKITGYGDQPPLHGTVKSEEKSKPPWTNLWLRPCFKESKSGIGPESIDFRTDPGCKLLILQTPFLMVIEYKILNHDT